MALGNWRLSRKWRERLDHWKKSIVNAVTRPWIMVTGFFSWVGQATVSAWNSRHFRLLIQGFPALFAVIGVGALVTNAQSMDRISLAKDYMRAGLKVAKDGDYELAQSYLEKALTLEGHKDETKFMLALVVGQSGKAEHCFAIMRTLAPETANGYPPAHLWLGDYVVRTISKNPESMRIVENHYQRAYLSASAVNAESVDTMNAAQRMGRLCVENNRFEDAVKYLEIAVAQYPYERLALAGALQVLNRIADRDRILNTLIEHCRLKLKGNINDKEARGNMAMAFSALEQFPEAIEVIQAGMAHDRAEKAFPVILANIYAFWDISLASKPDSKIINRFTLIQKGLNAMPAHRHHLARLVEFSELKGEDGEKAKQMMEEMLLRGESAPIIHFLLGGRAHQAGREEESKYHFEKAFALDPNFGYVANNLAFVLSHQKDPDLDRALKIINQAIEKMHGNPNMHGTRGQILVKMKRFKEALPDLEMGLRGTPNDELLHQSLADCHQALGNVSMGEMHQRKADDIRKAKPKKSNELLTPTGESFGPTTPTETPKSPDPPKPGENPKPAESPKTDAPKGKVG